MQRVLSSAVGDYVGRKILVRGWVQSVRQHRSVVFIDLRDRSGILQVVVSGSMLKSVAGLNVESVITARGIVTKRPEQLVNPSIVSGEVELQAEEVITESLAATLPFPLNDRQVAEEARLRYRYLDLRTAKMTENIRMRHRMNQFIRNWLQNRDFIEVETPYLSKATPEGARDYLVPSRIMPGRFYALPQSPQQYKQLLMVAGLERYYQIARCFRDEDSRGDRQPEFTQLDLELSYTNQEEILQLTEELITALVRKFFPERKLSAARFPRLTHAEAMAKYNTDRPDLRRDKSDPDELAFVFITDFPLFEVKEAKNGYGPAHHPFTAPKVEWQGNFEENPERAIAEQYDLVLNGFEIAGGSIRIHQPELLRRVFKFLGHSEEKIDKDFGHLLKAFEYGVPPHGGIAWGLDRLYMVLLKEQTIRDVIAFPKAGDGRDLLMDAPAEVEKNQLKELGIEIK